MFYLAHRTLPAGVSESRMIQRCGSLLRCVAAFWVLFMGAICASSQSKTDSSVPLQHFDVYTVKLNRSGLRSSNTRWQENSFSASNTTLKQLLESAYDEREGLVLNLPKWAASDHWDVQGKVTDFDPEIAKRESSDQHSARQQELLALLFGLHVHLETSMQPVYELTIAKDGPKLTAHKEGDATIKGGVSMITYRDRIDATQVPIPSLARVLESVVERSIVDRTGLPGNYDIKLRWSPEPGDADAPDANNTAPGIFQAVQEQLGLRLVPARAPVETLVVDTAVRPTEE